MSGPAQAPDRAPLPCWRVPGWEEFRGLVHGFFGRRGGVSTGPFASLNFGARAGDDPAHVRENWTRLRAEVGLVPVTMRQVHGDRIIAVRSGEAEPEEADGMATAEAGLALCVLTADCVPILLVEPARRIALAVHAGWRGTLAGIAERAVRFAAAEYAAAPADLHAALGPAIARCCYEVSAQIGAEIEARFGAMAQAWEPRGERGMLDLRAANRIILESAGVRPERIVEVGPCTACHRDELFSHRAFAGRTGRQISVVGFVAP